MLRAIKLLLLTALLLPASAFPVEPPAPQADAAASASSAPKKPGYHIGGFRIRPSVSLTQQHQSNVFAASDNELADQVTLVSPRLKIDSTWDRHSLRLQAGAELARHWQYAGEDYLDYQASAEGRYQLGPAADLFGGLGLSGEHEGRDSPDAASASREPTQFRTHNAHAGIKIRFGDNNLRLGGTFESLDFDNQRGGGMPLINDDRDRDLYGLGLRLGHAVEQHTELFVQAQYDQRDYRLSSDGAGFNRDSQGYRAAIGVKTGTSSGSSGEAYLGMLQQDYRDPAFASVNAIDFGARLNIAAAKNTRLKAELLRSLDETTDSDSPGYLGSTLNASLETRITPRLIPHLKAGYSHARYLHSGRKDHTWSAEGAVKYYLTRNSHLLAGIAHVSRDSNDANLLSDSNDYRNTTLFLTFSTLCYPLN